MTRVFNWHVPTLLAAALVAGVLAFAPNGAEAHHASEAGLELGNVVEVSSGWMHTCARTDNGEVYCWGNNATGNLGDGTAATVRPIAGRVDGIGNGPVRQISAGADHTCAISAERDVWCWGGNLAGQLGGIPADLGLIRRTPGKVTYFRMEETAPKFVSVSAGNSHTCALDTNGQIWCWGSNTDGQLGSGSIFTGAQDADRVDQRSMGPATKVIAGGGHTCGLGSGGAMWCWGDNADEQLGDGTNVDRRVPVRVSLTNGFPDGGVVTLSLGGMHTCASTANGAAYCWGSNTFGRIGSPSNTSTVTAQGPNSSVPVRVTMYDGGVLNGVTGISAGLDHTCAWKATGGVGFCWGRNVYGHLGDGVVSTNQPRPRHPIMSVTLLMERTGAIETVSAGYNHTCSLNAGGRVHCWGHNGLGQGGDGTFVFHKEPARVFRPPV